MRRTLVAAFLVALAGCGGGASTVTGGTELEAVPSSVTTTSTTTTITTTTTTTIPTTTTLSREEEAARQLEEDLPLIKQLWRGLSDTSRRGLDATYEYMGEHAHPQTGCTADDYRSYQNWEEGMETEVLGEWDTVEPDPGWTMNFGESSGEVPEGRIYIHRMTIISTWPDGYENRQELEGHVAILEGEAYFFIACSD